MEKTTTDLAIEFIKKAEPGPQKILARNIKFGTHVRGNIDYYYVCPSRNEYHNQFFWDSCFHSIAMSGYSAELAEAEINTLLKMQAPNGFIPHIIFWTNKKAITEVTRLNPSYFTDKLKAQLMKRLYRSPDHSELIQPPLLALAAYEVYKKTENPMFLQDMLPKVNRYYEYLKRHRDFEGRGLISIIHPDESGMDELPVYDVPFFSSKIPGEAQLKYRQFRTQMKYKQLGWDLKKIYRADRFIVKSLLINCSYVLNLRILSWLNRKAGNKKSANAFDAWAKKTEKAVIKHCYDREYEMFYDLYSQKNKKIRIMSIESLFPLMLNISGKMRQEIIRHLKSEEDFWTEYPVPSVPKSSRYYNPRHTTAMIWHTGESWPSTSWLIYVALKRNGYGSLAKELRNRNIELTKRSGFWEYYHPETAKGFGAINQSWTTIFYAEDSITKHNDI